MKVTSMYCVKIKHYNSIFKVNEEGAYVLVDNPLPVVVMKTKKKAPSPGSKEVNYHMICEVSVVGEKIFIVEMALVKSNKYIKALEDVLKELKISYELEGPFPKNLPWQDIPHK